MVRSKLPPGGILRRVAKGAPGNAVRIDDCVLLRLSGGRGLAARGRAQQVVERRAERGAEAAQRAQRRGAAALFDRADLRGGQARGGGEFVLLQAAAFAQGADGVADAAGLLLLQRFALQVGGRGKGGAFQAGLFGAFAGHGGGVNN